MPYTQTASTQHKIDFEHPANPQTTINNTRDSYFPAPRTAQRQQPISGVCIVHIYMLRRLASIQRKSPNNFMCDTCRVLLICCFGVVWLMLYCCFWVDRVKRHHIFEMVYCIVEIGQGERDLRNMAASQIICIKPPRARQSNPATDNNRCAVFGRPERGIYRITSCLFVTKR